MNPAVAGRCSSKRLQGYRRLPRPGHVEASNDSDIRIEAWRPSPAERKLQAVGDGGLAGSILPHDGLGLAGVIDGRGYWPRRWQCGLRAWAPEKLIDFAYRSTHEMAVA
jgi:hypothetical protein